jgi:UDP:flavonoid glycosyltransferase YjiC (YdhE family)
VVVDWLSYSKTMPSCDLVVMHGGHGTLMRALSCACPVVLSPAGGDMGENAARVDWAGLGVRLPRRLCTPRGVRLAVRRALGRPREPVDAVARWIAAHDARTAACEAIERWATSRGTP